MPRPWRALWVALAALLVAGCQEKLAGGAACPSLCPEVRLTPRDTVLTASQFLDTAVTLTDVPALGLDTTLVVADYLQFGERVQSAAVLRFDSLQRTTSLDTTKPPVAITRVDSALLTLHVVPAPPNDTLYTPDTTRHVGDTVKVAGDSLTFTVYDVDATGSDFDTAAVRARFSSTPIVSQTIIADSARSFIHIPLDSGFIAQHLRSGQRVRLGVTVSGSRPIRIRIGSREGSNGASLSYIGSVASDTTKKTLIVVPVNTRAVGTPYVGALADYTLVLHGSPPLPSRVLAIGGVPATRTFLRFALPSALVDSASRIVRADLVFWQRPDSSFIAADTLYAVTSLVRASTSLSDISAAAVLASDPSAIGFPVPRVLVEPVSPRADTISLVNVVSYWRSTRTLDLQRAIVVRSSNEGIDPRRVLFYDASAAVPDSLRPRLYLTYIPRSGFGLP